MATTYIRWHKLIDMMPDAFDISDKVAFTFSCVANWFFFYVCFIILWPAAEQLLLRGRRCLELKLWSVILCFFLLKTFF